MMKMMHCKGTVIRFVEQLDISDRAKEIAVKLIDQIDIPVVFLIDHGLDKNIATRNNVYHNQIWVLANHHEDHAEYERVILSNIYRGIQIRKRIAHPVPLKEYEYRLNQIPNSHTRNKRLELYHELLRKISSVVTTIDAEIYFKPLGIAVGKKQKEKLFHNCISNLDEYISMQNKQKDFVWFKECECINILDCARISSFNLRYYDAIKERMNKIRPVSISAQYIKYLDELLKAIEKSKSMYQSNSCEDITLWLTKSFIEIMHLENRMTLTSEYILKGPFVMENGEVANAYSFVPEDLPNQNAMIRGIRIVNECILLLREYNAILNYNLPDIHVNLIQSNHRNAYANLQGEEYYISITSQLISDIFNFENDCIEQVNEKYIDVLGMDVIKDRLIKYSLFYIAAHEYAHVINGDCKGSVSNESEYNLVSKKEEKADLVTKKLLKKVLVLQYRPNMTKDLSLRIRNMMINLFADSHLLDVACNWCDDYFLRLQNRKCE